MLVDQDYPNVFPFGCKVFKSRLDSRIICLGVYHKKVLLVVWGCRDML